MSAVLITSVIRHRCLITHLNLEVLLIPIVAVSMTDNDLSELEKLQDEGGFTNRSEVVSHALQSLLGEHRTLEDHTGDLTATMTVTYHKTGRGTHSNIVQHRFHGLIETMTHSHPGGGGCVEILIIHGPAESIRELVKAQRAQKQVVRVELSLVRR